MVRVADNLDHIPASFRDWVYGNTWPGIEYTINETKILTDIDVDIRTNLGTPALLGKGSTITFKIDKIRQLPLVLQEKK